MPISKLFVEGALDLQVLASVFNGEPLLQKGGSKNALKPRTRTERKENGTAAGYLRDRDFDFDPPERMDSPTVDFEDGGVHAGWRWCRHEIENYLLEPALVAEATEWPVSEYEDALRSAAKSIRIYEAGRWTVGVVRRSLPPQYDLQTRPDGLNEIALPDTLDRSIFDGWVRRTVAAHRGRIDRATSTSNVAELFESFSARFDGITEIPDILLWFSGKDILAGLSQWLGNKGMSNGGEFRAELREWIITNPERTLDLLPEWKALLESVRA
jgi:hypothetical protein